MKQKLAQSAIVVAMAVGGLSVAGSAAAQSAQDTQNWEPRLALRPLHGWLQQRPQPEHDARDVVG